MAGVLSPIDRVDEPNNGSDLCFMGIEHIEKRMEQIMKESVEALSMDDDEYSNQMSEGVSPDFN